MINTMLIIISILFIIATNYYFNTRDIKMFSKDRLLYTFLDSIAVLSFSLLTLLNGLIPNFLSVVGLVFLFMTVLYIRMFRTETHYNTYDVVLEPMKNTYLLFMRTIVAFMIGFTMFRFETSIMQFIYALSFVIVLNVLVYLARFITKKFREIRSVKYGVHGLSSYIITYSTALVIVVMLAMFNLPRHRINTLLNLNDYKPTYQVMQHEPTILEDNVKISIVNDEDFDILNETFINGEEGQTDAMTDHYVNYYIFYNESSDIEYYAYYNEDQDRTYYVTVIDGNETRITKSGLHYTDGYVVGDRIFLFDNQSYENFLITDLEFNIVSDIYLQEILEYTIIKSSTQEAIRIQIENDTLKIISSFDTSYQNIYEDHANIKSSYVIYSFTYSVLANDTNFYTFFNMNYIIILIAFLFVPITDYKKHVTTIGFDNEIKKERA